MRELDDDFLWGNSVSSMQTEGAWDEDGKGKSIYDIRKATEFLSDWKVATDSYHRYPVDFDLMKELGMNCYRFQISWSRVNPFGDGKFNEKGISFYNTFIDELIARGIEPMICLYHFDMPLNLAEKYNGFVSIEVRTAFNRFGEEMMNRFGDKVKYWITFNEQNLYQMTEGFQGAGYLFGEKSLRELYQIQHNMMMCHAHLTHYLHENFPKAQIGGMLTYLQIYPASPLPKDVFITTKANNFFNLGIAKTFATGEYSTEIIDEMTKHNLLDIITDEDKILMKELKADFISFSYYSSAVLSADLITDDTLINDYLLIGKKENPYLESTEWGWQIDPVGFRSALYQLYSVTGLPIFVIENGIGALEEWDGKNQIQDDYRIKYHKEHIIAMKDAIFYENVPVIGYLGWGLIDILSSQGDMNKRYGVVYVDRSNHDLRTLKRIPKKSFSWLKDLISENADSL